MTTTTSDKRIPVVSYLVLDEGDPHLVAWRCEACGALFVDRREACPACTGDQFSRQRLSNTGRLRAFTIVYRAAAPFVAGIVDLDGGGVVKAHVVGVPVDPAALAPGLRLRLTTYGVGADDDGTEAIAFAYEPDTITSTKENSHV